MLSSLFSFFSDNGFIRQFANIQSNDGNRFNKESLENDLLKYLERRKSLTPELEDYRININFNVSENDLRDSSFTFDYNLALFTQYMSKNNCAEITLSSPKRTKYIGYIRVIPIHNEDAFYTMSIDISNLFNKILIDYNSVYRFIEISKRDKSIPYTAVVPQNIIYEKFNNDEYYIFGSWKKEALVSYQIQKNLLTLLKDCNKSNLHQQKNILDKFVLLNYDSPLFEFVSFIPNAIIWADIPIYSDNSENGHLEFIKDLAKISYCTIDEIKVNGDYLVSVRVKKKWYNFPQTNNEKDVVKEFNKILIENDFSGKIHAVKSSLNSLQKGFMYLNLKDISKVNSSNLIGVCD